MVSVTLNFGMSTKGYCPQTMMVPVHSEEILTFKKRSGGYQCLVFLLEVFMRGQGSNWNINVNAQIKS